MEGVNHLKIAHDIEMFPKIFLKFSILDNELKENLLALSILCDINCIVCSND